MLHWRGDDPASSVYPLPARRPRAAVREGVDRDRLGDPAARARRRAGRDLPGPARRQLRRLPDAARARSGSGSCRAGAAADHLRRQRRRRGREDRGAQPARARRGAVDPARGRVRRAVRAQPTSTTCSSTSSRSRVDERGSGARRRCPPRRVGATGRRDRLRRARGRRGGDRPAPAAGTIDVHPIGAAAQPPGADRAGSRRGAGRAGASATTRSPSPTATAAATARSTTRSVPRGLTAERRALLRRVRRTTRCARRCAQRARHLLPDRLPGANLRAHGRARARPRPPPRAARRLLRQLPPRRLARAAADACHPRGGRSAPPRGSACRSRSVAVGNGGLERAARAAARRGIGRAGIRLGDLRRIATKAPKPQPANPSTLLRRRC